MVDQCDLSQTDRATLVNLNNGFYSNPDVPIDILRNSVAAACAHFFPEPQEPVLLEPALFGSSVGVASDAWLAPKVFNEKVLTPLGLTERPELWISRAYAAGGVGAQIAKFAQLYPGGVPLVYGPKTFSRDKSAWYEWFRVWLGLSPNLKTTIWPENDRHDIKKSAGWTNMTDFVATHKAAYEVLRDEFGREDVLWSNPTGWEIPSRWEKYVAPVLEYVCGVAVDGYLYQRSWKDIQAQAHAEFWVWEATQDPEAHKLLTTSDPTDNFTQATLADAIWVAEKCAALGKGFGGFEMGAEEGEYQDELITAWLKTINHIHQKIVPVTAFVYWNTGFEGSTSFRLNDLAAASFREGIAAHHQLTA